MFKILILFFINTTAFSAVPSAVPSVTVSAPGANTGSVSISPSMLSGTGTNGIFSLYATAAQNAGYFFVLYKNGTAYTTGSTTRAYCFDITATGTTANNGFQLVSSQAAISNGTSTALTNPFYQGGASGAYVLLSSATANVPAVVPGVYVFGDGVHATSAGFQTQGATGTVYLHMDCYEQ